jgi:hypothetical protein
MGAFLLGGYVKFKSMPISKSIRAVMAVKFANDHLAISTDSHLE